MTDDSLWVDGPDGFEDVKPAPAQKVKGRAKGDGRHIGCPLWWFKAVYPLMRGKGELAVAMALWRLRSVQKSRTVKVSNVGLLGELGINRWFKYRALKQLEAALNAPTIRRLTPLCRHQLPPIARLLLREKIDDRLKAARDAHDTKVHLIEFEMKIGATIV
jgi:hypothetical protein